MIYMPDAIRATISLMEAPAENIKIRSSYNVSGMSFNPQELTAEITKVCQTFRYTTRRTAVRQSLQVGRKV